MKTTKNKSEATETPKLVPIILIMDNLLKVHRLVNLDSLAFSRGRQFEETPSFPYNPQTYHVLLENKIKFRIECNVNIDPDNLRIACPYHDFGKQQWYTPNYMEYVDDVLLDVKFRSKATNKVRYAQLTLTDVFAELEMGKAELLQLSGGKLTQKQVKQLGLTLVTGELFSYYQAK